MRSCGGHGTALPMILTLRLCSSTTTTKRQRQGRRLPISKATANVITAQQQHIRERFPATTITDLALLPAPHANRCGRRSISGGTIDLRHRTWIDQLPPLRSRDGTEFSKAKIVPYCYRHTYAQRHAYAGVPIDVLRELMDHKRLPGVMPRPGVC